MDTDARITELEIRYTHQEQTIETLNQVVLSQQKIIEDFEARLTEIVALVKGGASQNSGNLGEEPPPPHY